MPTQFIHLLFTWWHREAGTYLCIDWTLPQEWLRSARPIRDLCQPNWGIELFLCSDFGRSTCLLRNGCRDLVYLLVVLSVSATAKLMMAIYQKKLSCLDQSLVFCIHATHFLSRSWHQESLGSCICCLASHNTVQKRHLCRCNYP